MWLHLPNSFASIVQPDPRRDHVSGDVLVVRVRAKQDLEAFRTHMPDLGPTLATPERDYPFRAFISRIGFCEGLVRIALAMKYTNFKDEVAKQLGDDRATLCSEVGTTMQRAENVPRRFLGGPRGPHRTAR